MKTDIYKHFKKYIIDIVKNKYPLKRRRKYSFEYYLENFVYVLNDLVKWSSLSILDKNKNHITGLVNDKNIL